MESWDGEAWTLDPTSDNGRMMRPRDLAQRVVADIVDDGGMDLDDLVFRVLPRLTVDDGLTLSEARDVASLARSLRGRPLAMETVPVRQVRIGDADMWEMIDPEAPRSFLVDGPAPVAAGGPARADFLALRPWPGTCP